MHYLLHILNFSSIYLLYKNRYRYRTIARFHTVDGLLEKTHITSLICTFFAYRSGLFVDFLPPVYLITCLTSCCQIGKVEILCVYKNLVINAGIDI